MRTLMAKSLACRILGQITGPKPKRARNLAKTCRGRGYPAPSNRRAPRKIPRNPSSPGDLIRLALEGKNHQGNPRHQRDDRQERRDQEPEREESIATPAP